MTGKIICWSFEKSFKIFFIWLTLVSFVRNLFLLQAGAPTIAANGIIISWVDTSLDSSKVLFTSALITFRFSL